MTSILSLNETIGQATVTDDTIFISTGASDRAVSTIGKFVVGDRDFLRDYGTEGSAATVSGLSSGVYQFDWSMYSKENDEWDKLYAWNGKELTLVGDRSGAEQISSARWTHDPTGATVNVLYDYITFFALDEEDKRGTTDFTIENFQFKEELPFDPPQPIDITPDYTLGDINLKDGYTGVATGSGDRAISTISRELTGDSQALSSYGTEGSIARWDNLENGTYEVSWYLYSREDDITNDAIYTWDGSNLNLFAERAIADQQTGLTVSRSDLQTTTIEVVNGELTFVALDSGDKLGTTELRITGLEKIDFPSPEGQPFNPVAEDGIGDFAVSDITTLTTAGVSTQILEDNFFRSEVSDFGQQGSAVLFVTEPGVNEVTVQVSTDVPGEDQLLVWDGTQFFKAIDTLENGTFTFRTDMLSDEWGLAVLDKGEADGDTTVEVTGITFLPEGVADNLSDPDFDPLIETDPDSIPVSAIADDGIGNFATNTDSTTLTTDGVSTQTLEDNFFRSEVSDFGQQGSAVLFTSPDVGVNRITFTVDTTETDGDQILIWDGQGFGKAVDEVSNGTFTTTFNAVSDEWGIAVLDTGDPDGNTSVTVTDIEFLPNGSANELDSPDFDPILAPEQTTAAVDLGTIGSGLSVQNEFIGTLGPWVDPEDNFRFRGQGAVEFRLENNETQAGIQFQLFDEEGLEIDRGLALESENTVEFDLPYLQDYTLKLIPNTGAYERYDFYLSRVPENGPEQTINPVFWGDITDSTELVESEFLGEILGVYNDPSDTYNFSVSNPSVIRFEVQGAAATSVGFEAYHEGELVSDGLITGDTIEFDVEQGEVELKLFPTQGGIPVVYDLSLEAISIPPESPEFDPVTGFRSEPPNPIPDNGWDMGDTQDQAWDLGTLKPWETDDITGLSWRHGYVFPTYHLGASDIVESIGAGDTDDWARFTLEEESYINLFTPSNATTELLDSDLNVIGSSPENNNSPIQDYLMPGDYYLHLSTGSGLETAFGAQLYLSNSDPNYAD